ncbi:hypothetical protein Presley_9 [Acinetobacter phage Presley]|uniref:Uncharacterized protein n=1 Tax=Acinetobacter phage Presley TaxID=1406780 RepID=U5PWF6_9CAUD|nr:hypothetical protein Presley_9 [Acinetobacter phage Presley]AGY48076.1 hypothetical protein Presley_9 [Acinetobacter phage Presley]
MSKYDDFMARFKHLIDGKFIGVPTPIAENWPVRTKIVATSTPVGVSLRSGMDVAAGMDYGTLENRIWPNPYEEPINLNKRAIKHMNEIQRTFNEIHKHFPEVVAKIGELAEPYFLGGMEGFHNINHYYNAASMRSVLNTHSRNIKYAVYAIYLKAWVVRGPLDMEHATQIQKALGKSLRSNSPARAAIYECIKSFSKLAGNNQSFKQICLAHSGWYGYEN